MNLRSFSFGFLVYFLYQKQCRLLCPPLLIKISPGRMVNPAVRFSIEFAFLIVVKIFQMFRDLVTIVISW